MKETKFWGLAPGIWAWVIQILLIFAWIPMDLWLGKNGYEYMTTEFKEGLKDPLTGVLLVFFTAGGVAAFIWHMWWRLSPNT